MRFNSPALLLALGAVAAPAMAQGFSPAPAVDINPAATIVEVNLTAAPSVWQYVPGQNTNVYAYNGQVPGPTIEANVGDTLIVHFTNNLSEDTTIHWHGIELPADQDGSHVSQAVIPPGATFDYQFPLLREGLYWYHPHVRTFDQLERGLHGCVLVKDVALEAQHGFDQIEEHVVVFDDILLDANYQVVPAFSFTDPLQNALYQVNGREGNHLLINGKVVDSVNKVTLTVPNGKPQRWRCLNVANTTFGRLDIHDPVTGLPPNTKIWELGNDAGFLEQPFCRGQTTSTFPGSPDHVGQALVLEMWDGIFMLPGERLDVVFTPIGNDGDVFTVQQVDWFRGRHTIFYGPGGAIFMGNDPLDGGYPNKPYFEIKLAGPDPGTGQYTPPSPLKTLPPMPTNPKGELEMHFGHGLPQLNGNVEFFTQATEIFGILTQTFPASKVTTKEAFDVEVGDVWDWKVNNMTHGDHPFHTHGFFFEVLEFEFQDVTQPPGYPNNFKWRPTDPPGPAVGLQGPGGIGRRVIKDTLRLPPRLGAKGTSRCIARLRMHIDDTGREGQVAAHGREATFHKDGSWTSGGWLVHCHILEHAKVGMLSFFEVHEPDDPFWFLGHHIPGTAGKASLTGRDGRAAGGPLNMDLVNGMPNQPAFLLLGATRVNLPFTSAGILVPGPPCRVLTGVCDPQGEFCWSFTLPRRLPSGIPLWWHAGFLDAGGTEGWALSNAVRYTTP